MNTVPKIDPKQATPVPAPGIHSRMVAILRDLDAIGKDQRNTQQNFQYRGIDQVYNAINPLLARHGVYMTAEVLGKTREERQSKTGGVLAFTCLRMRYHFHAEDGSSVHTEAEGEGMDSGDKSSNKGMAVAHKYALLQAFCVPTKDMDDPDAQSHEVAASKPSAAAPTYDESDPDGQTKAWRDRQKTAITKCATLPALYGWLAQVSGDSGTISDPESGTAMDRLKRKSPEIYGEVVQAFQAHLMTINRKENK